MVLNKWVETTGEAIFQDNSLVKWLTTIFATKNHTHDKSEISNFAHTHSGWTSQSVGTYGTLYVNTELRLCEFAYNQDNYTGLASSAGTKTLISSSSFPSAYKPLNRVVTPTYRGDTTVLVETSGAVNLFGLNTINSINIHVSLMWHY